MTRDLVLDGLVCQPKTLGLWGGLGKRHDQVFLYEYHIGSRVSGEFERVKTEGKEFATIWMDFEGVMLSEVNQTEENKYCMISHTWNLKRKPPNQAPMYRGQTGGWQR